MQVTNKSNSRLQLADGTAIDAGQTVDVDKFDDKNHVVKAWLDAGLIETGKAASKSTKEKE
jgi:hypothetical protein